MVTKLRVWRFAWSNDLSYDISTGNITIHCREDEDAQPIELRSSDIPDLIAALSEIHMAEHERRQPKE